MTHGSNPAELKSVKKVFEAFADSTAHQAEAICDNLKIVESNLSVIQAALMSGEWKLVDDLVMSAFDAVNAAKDAARAMIPKEIEIG